MALLFVTAPVFSGGSGQSPGAAPSNMPANDGPFASYPETLTIAVPISIQTTVPAPPQGETWEKNFVTSFYQEKLNIAWKSTWTVDQSQANEKLNAAIASNDLPDMFMTGTEALGRMIKAEQVQPLDEAYERYASPRLREIVDFQEKRGWLPGFVNGKHYALPAMNDAATSVVMLFIRKDWLDKLNLKEPTTIDELLVVARAFRDRDPDGNGQRDTIAFALDRDLGVNRTGINSLANPLGAYPRSWIKDGKGGLTHGSIQPEMKEVLSLMRTMYSEGLIDREFAVKDTMQVSQDVIAGKVGIMPGLFWTPGFPLVMSVEANPAVDWIPIPILMNRQGKRISQNNIAIAGTFVVRTGFPHPEALIKTMNLWAEMFHGEYAEHFQQLVVQPQYQEDFGGNWQMMNLPAFFQHPDKNVFLSDNVIEAIKANNIDLCTTGEARRTVEMIQAGGPNGWAQSRIFNEGGTIQTLKRYDSFMFNEFLGAPTSTMILRTATLEKLEDEMVFGIITGSQPLDSFDKFVSDWKAQGGDQIIKEVSDWYRSVQ
jgi:putative aldouronate transport system substrate-binding protein